MACFSHHLRISVRHRDALDEGLGINLCLGVKMQFNFSLTCMFHLDGRDAQCVFS